MTGTLIDAGQIEYALVVTSEDLAAVRTARQPKTISDGTHHSPSVMPRA